LRSARLAMVVVVLLLFDGWVGMLVIFITWLR
jgi:hypothetical protein